MQRIEVLSTFDQQDPVFRAKILGLKKALQESHIFESFSNDKPCKALLLRLNLTKTIPEPLLAALRLKSKQTQIHLFVPDFEGQHEAALASLHGIVHVYLVATPELQFLLSFKVPGMVRHLPDPIDFGLTTDRQRVHVGPKNNVPLRLAWFGYPESYTKSMRALEPTFDALARSGQATLSVYTTVTQPGLKPYGYLKPYRVDTILSELDQHDGVLLSHLAFDLSVNTHFKSENKAVLAINRGLPVIASDTPAYARLLGMFGLNDFLFNSKETLIAAVAKLRSPEARNAYLKRCQSRVTSDYNHAQIARLWVMLLENSSC
jgi:hypothetical protein